MFFEIFNWILSAFGQIFNLLKEIEIFPGFTYFSLAIALFFVSILGFLLKFIFGGESESD